MRTLITYTFVWRPVAPGRAGDERVDAGLALGDQVQRVGEFGDLPLPVVHRLREAIFLEGLRVLNHT